MNKFLIAVGRHPNFDGLGLENTSIELTDGRYIKINETLEAIAEKVFGQ